jgi:transposase
LRAPASYLGVVASEHSSGQRRRLGPITKSGSCHARRLLVEAAWRHRKAPATGVTLTRRQHGQRATVTALACKAQQRLHRAWRRRATQRGKRRTLVAVVRELVGFRWAIARASTHALGSAPDADRSSRQPSTMARQHRPDR